MNLDKEIKTKLFKKIGLPVEPMIIQRFNGQTKLPKWRIEKCD